MKILDIDKSKTIANGDGNNDMPMLEAAGFKVAIDNAPIEVKTVANFIAPSLADDGVAATIERFILKV